MICPCEKKGDTSVVDSRPTEDGTAIRRRRLCVCGERFTTYETAELMLPKIIKQNDIRQPFDEDKLKSGILRALEKRPVSVEQIETALNNIKHELIVTGEREVSSIRVGEAVMSQLRELDHVAYVRFASVYRSFEDLNEFRQEIDKLSAEEVE